MYLARLELENVRSFDQFQCDFSNQINIIYGSNGIGKTTILEAIYILSLSKSFRPGRQNNILKKGTENLKIRGHITTEPGKNINIAYYRLKDEKRLKINDRILKSFTELIGEFPVVVMSPEGEDVISGPGQIRRNYINRLFSIVDSDYLRSLKEFEKTRKHRNILLQMGDYEQADIWAKPFIKTGFEIWEKRKQAITEFIALFTQIWQDAFPDQTAEIVYQTTPCKDEDEFASRIDASANQERFKKRTVVGPHRDDLQFILNSRDLRNFGSQGEKKTFLSVLKKAEAMFIELKLAKKPVVLLDDLFAKLDSFRSTKIIKLFMDDFQTFITTTDLGIGGLLEDSGVKTNQINLSAQIECCSS